MAKHFPDSFVPIPRRKTPHRISRAPKLRPRSLQQAIKERIGGLKGRSRFSGPTFIQRSREQSSEQKAIWHNETGAGRSHVLRKFFGLTQDEQTKVQGLLGAAIEQRLREISA